MQNIRIANKFLLIVAMFGIVYVLVASHISRQMAVITDGYRDLVESDALGALAMAKASRNMQTVRASVGDLLMARTEKSIESARQETEAAQAATVKFLDEAMAAMPDNSEIPKLRAKMLNAVNSACARSIELRLQATNVVQIDESQRAYRAECRPAIEELTPEISRLVMDLQQGAASRSVALQGQADSRLLLVQTASAMVVLTVVGLGLFAVRRWIVHPLLKLAADMGDIAQGNLSGQIEGQGRGDELGVMARAVAVFRENAIKVRELEDTRARAAQVERQRAEEMAAATTGLADGLRRMSTGDFGFELSQPYAEEFEPLRADFNAVAQSLRDSMLRVAQTTGRIEDGSRELRESAAELSRRTEGQAAAVEQQSAALSQITANVRDASDRSTEAKQEAERAASFAETSESVVASAFSAMQRIESSSAEISTISGLIDEISFQTNLLALNASVEAARAGDAGRGFAVVAQEVRALAQRSARAAQEIKELIRKSVDEVEGGVKLVLSAGDALKKIGQQVHRVNGKLDAIAQSAREQVTALAEISSAVAQTDRATQQNAAMSEETLAAASTLSTEADALRRVLATFRLGEGQGGLTALRAVQGGRPPASGHAALRG